MNLTDNPVRQDIYGAVAEKATAALECDPSDIARIALEIGITRALCKRPVMIVPYAGTFSACMDYVFDYYKELAESGEVLPLPLDRIRMELAPLVAKYVWDAISDTVIAARGAMDWVTHTARLASRNGQKCPIQWETPDGFVVQQAKYDERSVTVNTFLDGGRRIRSQVTQTLPTLDPRKMSQSLSPNYIHSLDACHMRMAINMAIDLDRGFSFAMIHDSFGVHAADMPVFVEECIKPAFVGMYRGKNLLEKFRRELMVNIAPEDHAEVRELPPMGRLNIEKVLDSQFFFS